MFSILLWEDALAVLGHGDIALRYCGKAWGSNSVPHIEFLLLQLPCVAAIPSGHCWRASPHSGSSHWAAGASAARAERCAHGPCRCKCESWPGQRTWLQTLSACEQSTEESHVTARRWTSKDSRFGVAIATLVTHHVLPCSSPFPKAL